MHCNKIGWSKLCAVHASGGHLALTVPALPLSSKHFICLWWSRITGIIQEKIDNKGYYVCCKIHFPNNNVRKAEVMRAELFYPTIGTLPQISLCLLAGYLSVYSHQHLCLLTPFIPPSSFSFVSFKPSNFLYLSYALHHLNIEWFPFLYIYLFTCEYL